VPRLRDPLYRDDQPLPEGLPSNNPLGTIGERIDMGGEIIEGSRYFYTTPDRGIAASLQDLTRLFTGKPACEAWSKGIAGV
jgi:hypothetical protein